MNRRELVVIGIILLIGVTLLACAFPYKVITLLQRATSTPLITLTFLPSQTPTPYPPTPTFTPTPITPTEAPTLEEPTITETLRPTVATFSPPTAYYTYVPPLSAPILIAPKDVSGKMRPYYEWVPVTNATIYILWVWMLDSNGDRSVQVIFEKYLAAKVCNPPGVTNKCLVRPDVQLLEGRMYEWYMQAYGPPGYSGLSNVASFKAAQITDTPGPTLSPTITPTIPITATVLAPVTVIPCGHALSVALDNNNIYFSDSKILMKYSKPPTPAPIATITAPANANIVDIFINNPSATPTIFIVAENSGLLYTDENLSNFSTPSPEWTPSTQGKSIGVTVKEPYAYVAANDKGVRIIDISISPPKELDYYSTSGNAYAVKHDDNFLYIAASTAGLRIRPLYSPGGVAPELGACDTPGSAFDVALYSPSTAIKYAYIADYQYGIFIADVSSPSNCKQVGSFNTQGEARSVAIDAVKKRLYIANGSKGLLVLDLSDPKKPQPYQMNTTITGYDIAIDDNYIYLAAYSNDLIIYPK